MNSANVTDAGSSGAVSVPQAAFALLLAAALVVQYGAELPACLERSAHFWQPDFEARPQCGHGHEVDADGAPWQPGHSVRTSLTSVTTRNSSSALGRAGLTFAKRVFAEGDHAGANRGVPDHVLARLLPR
jgi:hypothetical protein